MKTTILKLMSLNLALTALAVNAAPRREATQVEIKAINALFNEKIVNSKELAVFRSLVDYVDGVRYEESKDKNTSLLSFTGLVLFQGDIACGSLSLQVKGQFIETPRNPIAPGYTKYSASLVGEGLADYCQDYVNDMLGGLKLSQAEIRGELLPNSSADLLRHLLKRQITESEAFKQFSSKVQYVTSAEVEANEEKVEIQLSGIELQGDIALGYKTLRIKGKSKEEQGIFGPITVWNYSIKFKN